MKKVYLVKVKNYDYESDEYVSEVVSTKKLAKEFAKYLKIIFENQNKIVWIVEEPVDNKASIERMRKFMEALE